ncbi:efflux RND transporter permease subunit [bacterium]|nr:MAG: efflux RND transporter permease subunit [bacterium]
MNLSSFAVSHLKALIFVTLILCVAGLLAAGAFPVSILPDVTFPRLVVIAEGGDAPASQMEVSVTRPLEDAASTVAGVHRVRSTTQRGAAELSIDFADSTNMQDAQNLMNARLNEIRANFPLGTQVSVERMTPTVFPVLGLSLQSNTLSQSQLWELATYTLRPRLARVEGVARVVVQGGRAPEIAVEADPQRLAALRLSVADLSDALAKTNVVRATGRFDAKYQQYQALVSGRLTDIPGIENTVVSTRAGVPILVRQVASVHPSTEDRTTVVTADGRESVLLNIVRQPNANSVAVAAGIKAEMALLRKELPASARLSVFYDQSILINDAVTSVRDAVILGAFLSVVVLLLFLGDWRATLVTASIIPATLFISFVAMRLAGLTLNLMTLGALAVGIGLVIDDAIVVVENVFRHLAAGQTPREATQSASREISAPMISSTLTTVVVFLPLMLLSGVAGAFFSSLAITLSLALLISLVLALFLSPSLCATFLRLREGHSDEGGPIFQRLVAGYERTLRFVLRHRIILPVSVVLLLGSTWAMGQQLQSGFMPEMDEGAFILDYLTPTGTSLTESDHALQKIEEILAHTPEVASYSRRTGTELGFAITEPNRGDFAVMLKEGKRRPVFDVISDIRSQIDSQVPGVQTDFIQVLQDLIGDLSGAPSPVEIKLWSEDPVTLRSAAEDVAAHLEKISGVVDVASGVVDSGPEYVLKVDEVRAGRAGLTADAIASQMNSALFGDAPTQIMQGDRPVTVRVRLPLAFRDNPTAIGQLQIASPLGFSLPLSSLGALQEVGGQSEIQRENQRRLLPVTAGLEGRDLGSVMTDVSKMMSSYKLPPGVTYELGGQAQSQNQAFSNLVLVLALAIALVFGVMLFQFGSFTAPLTILGVMPLALFGVALGLWLTGTPLNVSSFMGAIMLVGIVVKNGILLLDHAQNAERDGQSPEEAVQEAGRVRLRPILMTTLTAILGLVPLALGLGAGAEMQKPLAIGVIGGLSFSTLFTLLFAPSLYVSMRRFQLRFTGRRLAQPEGTN